MFTKKPESGPPPLRNGGPPATGQQAQSSAVSQISADLTIIGNLISQGEVQIDGEVQGDVHATTILVGENARITGGLVAEDVIVRGAVMGSVRGKRVILQSSSKVEGDVFHQQLGIEQGAFFEGKSRRVEDPTAGVQRPEFGMSSNGYAGNTSEMPPLPR